MDAKMMGSFNFDDVYVPILKNKSMPNMMNKALAKFLKKHPPCVHQPDIDKMDLFMANTILGYEVRGKVPCSKCGQLCMDMSTIQMQGINETFTISVDNLK